MIDVKGQTKVVMWWLRGGKGQVDHLISVYRGAVNITKKKFLNGEMEDERNLRSCQKRALFSF